MPRQVHEPVRRHAVEHPTRFVVLADRAGGDAPEALEPVGHSVAGARVAHQVGDLGQAPLVEPHAEHQHAVEELGVGVAEPAADLELLGRGRLRGLPLTGQEGAPGAGERLAPHRDPLPEVPGQIGAHGVDRVGLADPARLHQCGEAVPRREVLEVRVADRLGEARELAAVVEPLVERAHVPERDAARHQHVRERRVVRLGARDHQRFVGQLPARVEVLLEHGLHRQVGQQLRPLRLHRRCQCRDRGAEHVGELVVDAAVAAPEAAGVRERGRRQHVGVAVFLGTRRGGEQRVTELGGPRVLLARSRAP